MDLLKGFGYSLSKVVYEEIDKLKVKESENGAREWKGWQSKIN